MAASNTIDVRTHVMGDMLMLTGTFTDGGKEVSFDGLLTNVFAAGGHLTSLVFSGVTINNGSTEAIGQTVLTCDTSDVAGDCRSCLNVGQTLYSAAGARLGLITAVTATAVTIDTALTVALADDAQLFVMGASSMALKADAAITSHNVALDVSVDETNNLVIFSTGNESSATSAATSDGRWWILGQR
tara:strand:+ start:330 stop:890 length:561 start_codon:yes stop_codon:yes gene_type:complete